MNIIEQLKQTSVKGTELPKIKPAVSLVILVIGVILTLAFTYSSIRFAKTRELANFSESVKQTRLMVENKFQHYVFLLRSTAGLFIASDQVLPNEFDSFIDGLELEKNYPGIAEIGYFTVKDNEDDLEIEVVFGRAVRQACLTARPTTPNSSNIVTSSNLPALSELDQALKKANRTGQPALSTPINLPILNESDSQTSPQCQNLFFLLLPDYQSPASDSVNNFDFSNNNLEPFVTDQVIETQEQNNQQKNVEGFIFLSFQADYFFSTEILQNPSLPVDFVVYQNIDEQPLINDVLYSSVPKLTAQSLAKTNAYTQQSILQIVDQTWQVFWAPNDNFTKSFERNLYPLYLFAGLSMSFLVFLLSRLHSKTLTQAELATHDLYASQEALKRSRLLYQAVVENASDLVTIIDLVGNVLYASPSHEEVLGYNPEDLANINAFQLLHPDDFESVRIKVAGLADGGSGRAEFRFKRKDGSYILLEGIGTGIVDDRGKVGAVFIISRDITERKEIEKRKDEFMTIASHELKTPVTSLKIYTQYLQEYFQKCHDPVALELLNKMNQQLGRLTNLIRDLLDVSRLEAGKLQLRTSIFDLTKIVKETIAIVQLTTEKHTIYLTSSRVAMVQADPDRISQVLVNLLTNAVKYSPQSDRIEVSVNADNEQVKVCIRDYGLGIPKSKRKQVFDRFFRLNRPKSETYAGFGLGLYICAQIIDRHEGKIWVQNTVGPGSTFCFSLPIVAKKRKSRKKQNRSTKIRQKDKKPNKLLK